jgi:hypothetical protein
MAKPNGPDNQPGQYDKIIKENLEITLPVIIKEVLHLDIAQSEELPDDIQHTKERKPDALKKVTDTAGHTYVLHVEFQIADEKEMVYRMAEYSIMLLRRYKLPVKQYVIFLKDVEPTMDTSFESEDYNFRYQLIRIAQANYQLFLKADNPEVKMLGILANFGKEDSYEAVKAIVNEVQSFAKSDFAESRYFEQLRIFVQLRGNIKQQFLKVMESVSKYFKEEDDFLFERGEAKGEVKKDNFFVKNLILESDWSDERIARISGVSVEFVKGVRETLKK